MIHKDTSQVCFVIGNALVPEEGVLNPGVVPGVARNTELERAGARIKCYSKASVRSDRSDGRNERNERNERKTFQENDSNISVRRKVSVGIYMTHHLLLILLERWKGNPPCPPLRRASCTGATACHARRRRCRRTPCTFSAACVLADGGAPHGLHVRRSLPCSQCNVCSCIVCYSDS